VRCRSEGRLVVITIVFVIVCELESQRLLRACNPVCMKNELRMPIVILGRVRLARETKANIVPPHLRHTFHHLTMEQDESKLTDPFSTHSVCASVVLRLWEIKRNFSS